MENKNTQTTSSQTISLPERPFKSILFSPKEFSRRFREDSRFREFAKQVYGYLDTMKMGHRLCLNRYHGEKLEWIVLTAAAFMAEGSHGVDYCFSNDFTAIHHYYVDQRTIKMCNVAHHGDADQFCKEYEKQIQT